MVVHGQKHFVFKSHRSHKFMLGLISFIVLLIGILLGKNISILRVSDPDFRTFTVVLLFVLNLIIIILILILAEFLIDLKDAMSESEQEVLTEEKAIEDAIRKQRRKKR